MRETYTVLLRPEPEGEFTVKVPALPGCLTRGRTVLEALRNAEDAIQGYLVSLAKHDEPIPHEEEVTFPTGNLTEALIYRVSVEVREVAQAA
jgi:predicted RNase H-like HicB family nuclease